jgi:hypothetical protein
MIRDLEAEEHGVSYDRKMLQGWIDILKATLATRSGGDPRDQLSS